MISLNYEEDIELCPVLCVKDSVETEKVVYARLWNKGSAILRVNNTFENYQEL